MHRGHIVKLVVKLGGTILRTSSDPFLFELLKFFNSVIKFYSVGRLQIFSTRNYIYTTFCTVTSGLIFLIKFI